MVSCPKNLVGYSLIIKGKVGGGKRSPFSSFFFFFFNYLFVFACAGSSLLPMVFSLVAASGGCPLLWCEAFSLQRLAVAERGL